MLKFRVSKSGFYQIAKSIAGDSYDKVYKDIISFMKDLEKKEESKEVKKAIEYFESSESNFSHLEKSVNGDWIEKAGYGVGTIRIWKGKKYKKISASPTRWVRVFDKNDRGAKNAMTRLIHEAEKYKNDPEGMMKLLLANKQRFYDEDSKRYLDIVDRLNAFVDNADSTGPMGEKQVKEIHNKIEENKKKGKKVTPYEAQKQIDDEKLMNKVKEINANAKEKEESESKMPDVSKLSRDEILSEMAKQVKLKTNKDEKYYEALRTELDKYNKVAEQLRNEAGEKIDIDNFPLGKIGKKIDGEYPRFNIEQQKKLANRIIEQYGKTDKTRQLLGKLMDFNSQKNQYLPYNPYGDSWDYIESKINIEPKEPEPAKTTKSTPSTESPFSVSESSDYENKPPIATNVKSGENEVTMPYSKELNEELKTLKNCVAGDYSTNKAMQNIYYSDGNLVTTDGRRLKIVKVGELDGIPNNSFVDFDSNKSGIKIKKIEVNSPFPKYSQVIPKDLNNKATLNNKVLKEKIKEMQKDGAIQKKTDNSVQLEIKDGNILIDDTIVGKTDVKDLKWSRNWGEEQTRTNYISINADYLVNALNGNESVLMMGDNASKAMTVNTGSTVNVLMPMYGSDQKVDYSEGRQKKTEENQRKSKLKEIYRNSMDDYMKDLNSQTSDESYERLKNAVANADKKILQTAYDAYKKADKQYKNSSGGNIYDNRYGFKLLATAQKYPDFKTIFMDAVQKQGIEVKKSLFDFMDPFILDEIEIDDSDEEELQNYDASTPELFNSTSYKVADALDECFGCK